MLLSFVAKRTMTVSSSVPLVTPTVTVMKPLSSEPEYGESMKPMMMSAKQQAQIQYLYSLERASQGEQNGANFSSVAPSSEELWVRKDKTPLIYELGVNLSVSFTRHWKVL